MNQTVTYRVGREPKASAAPRGGNTLLAWALDSLPMRVIFPALTMAAIIGPSLWQMHLVK